MCENGASLTQLKLGLGQLKELNGLFEKGAAQWKMIADSFNHEDLALLLSEAMEDSSKIESLLNRALAEASSSHDHHHEVTITKI